MFLYKDSTNPSSIQFASAPCALVNSESGLDTKNHRHFLFDWLSANLASRWAASTLALFFVFLADFAAAQTSPQTYPAAGASFTAPAGIHKVTVQAWGGGGAGGGSNNATTGGAGGGGGGAYVSVLHSVTPGVANTVTVGTTVN